MFGSPEQVEMFGLICNVFKASLSFGYCRDGFLVCNRKVVGSFWGIMGIAINGSTSSP